MGEEKTLTTKALSVGLREWEKIEGTKSIHLELTPGQKPVVEFGGFWDGKFIRAALNSISRAYRLRKFRPSRPQVGTPEKEVLGGENLKGALNGR